MNSTAANTTTICSPDYMITVVFPCLYSIVFPLALILNVMAAWIFFKVPTDSTFVVYLKNVVVADILMTLTIPVKVLYYVGLSPRDLCVAYCRYSTILFKLSMYTSIAFLGLISLDRYLKIVWPFGEFAVQKVRVGQALSAAVWLFFSSVAITNMALTNKPPPHAIVVGELQCSSLMSEYGQVVYKASIYALQVVFWLTLIVMVFCYSFITRKVYKSYKATRRIISEPIGRKTKAKVLVVVVVFFICFAPYHFYLISYLGLVAQNPASHSCREKITMYNAIQISAWLSTTNACLDPLIYILLCKKFRTGLVATLTCVAPSHKPATTPLPIRLSPIVATGCTLGW